MANAPCQALEIQTNNILAFAKKPHSNVNIGFREFLNFHKVIGHHFPQVLAALAFVPQDKISTQTFIRAVQISCEIELERTAVEAFFALVQPNATRFDEVKLSDLHYFYTTVLKQATFSRVLIFYNTCFTLFA